MAAGAALLAIAAALLPRASAAGCGGCGEQGLAVFNPFAEDDGRGYALMRTDDGAPVRYDPCTPIHYVVNPASAPPSWRDDLAGALTRLSDASGLRFVSDGSTSEVAARRRPAFQPARYGNQWAPVLIAWSRPADTDLLALGTSGNGGSTWARHRPGPAVLVTGTAVIDAELAARLPAGFGMGATHGRLLAHELGHVLGLAHAHDPAALMAPRVGWDADVLTAGDRAGLARVGARGGCLAAPLPASPSA
jgi:hypothetical protein